MFWDGETSPSVWAPLGDFFATSPGINSFKTLAMGCIEGTFYSYWYMPYADGAQIAFANDGEGSSEVGDRVGDGRTRKSAAARLLRFNAAWHSDDFTGLDAKRFLRKGGDRWPDWPLLVVEGKGRYVGMTEHIWKFGGWWGEGDEKFFIDGEKYPSTVGTGSEDYIGYAWAANPPFITFDSALAAGSRLRPDAQEDTSVCRFHVCDDVPFATASRDSSRSCPTETAGRASTTPASTGMRNRMRRTPIRSCRLPSDGTRPPRAAACGAVNHDLTPDTSTGCCSA